MTQTAEPVLNASTNLVKNADGDDFQVFFDHHFQEWCAEQWNGLGKNYLHIPARLHDKDLQNLLRDVRQHRSQS